MGAEAAGWHSAEITPPRTGSRTSEHATTLLVRRARGVFLPVPAIPSFTRRLLGPMRVRCRWARPCVAGSRPGARKQPAGATATAGKEPALRDRLQPPQRSAPRTRRATGRPPRAARKRRTRTVGPAPGSRPRPRATPASTPPPATIAHPSAGRGEPPQRGPAASPPPSASLAHHLTGRPTSVRRAALRPGARGPLPCPGRIPETTPHPPPRPGTGPRFAPGYRRNAGPLPPSTYRARPR